MGLLQERRACTVHDGQGGRCGTVDQCTHVLTRGGDGEVLHEHWVCSAHRRQMDLPEHAVVITPEGEARLFG